MVEGKQATGEPGKNSGIFYGYIIVAASLLISIIMWGSRFSFGVFIGPLLDEFGWSRGLTSTAFSITWIGTGLLSILVGRINDRFGPRLVMSVAGCFLGIGYYLMSTLNSITQLFIFHSVINIGMSAILVPIMTTIARWFYKMRALMSGVVVAGTGIALIFIVPLANHLICCYSWRKSYLLLGLATFALVVLCAQLLRRDPFVMGKSPYGYEPSDTTSAQSEIEGLSFKESLFTPQLYQLAIIYGCVFLLYNLVISHILLYATGEGIAPERAVIIISALGLAGIPGRILMGIFADKLGQKPAMVTSGILMVVSFFWLLISNKLWMLILFAVVFGFGHGGMATAESPVTAQIFGMRAHGSILGLVFTGDSIGGALGPIIAGYVFDSTRSYILAFKISIAIALLNLIAILLLKPTKRKMTDSVYGDSRHCGEN